MRKKIVSLLLVQLMVICSIIALPVENAHAKEHKKVRVGYMWGYHFQEGTKDGEPKSGFSYDWLQQIASYAGWEYEYVYGSWEECYEMLVKGKIDIMSGISYTPDRVKDMNFPDLPISTESYYIFVKEADQTGYPGLKSLKGKSIGVSGDTLTAERMKKWNKANKMGMRVVDYPDDDARLAAFKKGETDTTADLSMQVSKKSGMVPVLQFGSDSTYIAVAKDRQDLLLELNEAVSNINTTMPAFASNLMAQYFADTAVMSSLSSEDGSWFAEHPTLQVGYMENMPPFSEKEKGSAAGTYVDVLEYSLKRMNLKNKVKYHGYTDMENMLRDLKSGKLDLAGPLYSSVWEAEQKDILQSIELTGVRMNMVSCDETKIDKSTRFAVAESIPGHEAYLKEFYPKNKLTHYATEREALAAIKTGDVDAMVMSSYLVSIHLRYDDTLKVTPLDHIASLSVAFNQESQAPLGVLNRGISAYGYTNIQESLLKHTDAAYTPNLYDFIRANAKAIAVVIFLLIVLSVAVLIYLILRRRHKRVLEAMRVAEEANRAKTAFLFNMSHDIRTPMNAVIGLSGLAKSHTEDPEKMKSYLDQISVAGDQLLAIINNVLELSRIESQKVSITEDVTDLEEVFRGIRTVFNNQTRASKLNVSLQKELRHRYLYMDRTHVEQVVINLLSNALKYTPDGGDINMSVTEIAGDSPDTCKIRFVIQDTGIGMSKEYQEKLFQQFEREQNSTVSGIQGTGLGLSIVKKLVDLMQGEITVKSKQKVGTTVTVVLPHRIAEAPAKTDLDMDNGEDMLAGKRVLMAEDIDINAMIAAELLSSRGIEVERAVNGRECLDKLKAAEAGYYSLILMDIQMPEMNGYEASRAIRSLEDPRKAEIPIIAMTANAFKEDRENARAAGMNGHVAKPIDVSQLFSTLNKVLAYQKYHMESEVLEDFRKEYQKLGKECGYFIYRDRPDETVVYADHQVAELYGCETVDEFLQYVDHSFRNMIHPEDLMETESRIVRQQIESVDHVDQVEYRILRKDGQVRKVRDIGYKSQKGQEKMFYVYIVDVTEE